MLTTILVKNPKYRYFKLINERPIGAILGRLYGLYGSYFKAYNPTTIANYKPI